MRIEGWEKALVAYIEDSALKQFKWGKFDCLVFVADAIKVTCGVDVMSKKLKDDPETIRGAYDSELQAKKLIKEIRGNSENIMDVHFDRILISYAKRGDVVLYKGGFGVCMGSDVFFKNETNGYTAIKKNKDMVSWSVE